MNNVMLCNVRAVNLKILSSKNLLSTVSPYSLLCSVNYTKDLKNRNFDTNISAKSKQYSKIL